MPRPFLLAVLASLAISQAPVFAQDPHVVLDLGGGVRLDAIRISKGKFLQGSPPSEPSRQTDELSHLVTITHDYYMGTHPVTVGQFRAFVKATGYRTEAEKGTSGGYSLDRGEWRQDPQFSWRSPGFPIADDHPVTLVTYNDALEFCKWLTRASGKKIDLPTEAQWEYACRAGTTTAYYSGQPEKDADQLGWFRAKDWKASRIPMGTHPVGRKKPNNWGLHDMVGHVFQWCHDWYGPYSATPATDPSVDRPPAGEKPRRVLRGGSWFSDAPRGRSASRYQNDAASRNANNGFRIVFLAPETHAANPVTTPPKGESGTNQAKTPQQGAPITPPVQTTTPPPVQNRELKVMRQTQEQPETASPLRILGPVCGGLACIGFLVAVFVAIRSAVAAKNRAESGIQPKPDRIAGVSTARTTGTSRPIPPMLPPRSAPDGFWLETAEMEGGSLVNVQYHMQGQSHTKEVVVTPSPQGQFVYTGDTPTQIVILSVLPPLPDQPPVFPGHVIPPSHRVIPPSAPPPDRVIRRADQDPEPFRGYPSAY